MRKKSDERTDIVIACVAQLVEHLICNENVVGSNPTTSSGL
jgi:hypothetical protein